MVVEKRVLPALLADTRATSVEMMIPWDEENDDREVEVENRCGVLRYAGMTIVFESLRIAIAWKYLPLMVFSVFGWISGESMSAR